MRIQVREIDEGPFGAYTVDMRDSSAPVEQETAFTTQPFDNETRVQQDHERVTLFYKIYRAST